MVIWVLAGFALLILLSGLVVMLLLGPRAERKALAAESRYAQDAAIPFYVTGGGLAAIGLVLTLWMGWLAVGPQYRLWRASIEKRILVEEAIAERDSAVEYAEAERIRAEGVADANEIISVSIDEQYIRWLFVNNLADHNASEIIYIPTEANLPILEAGGR